MINSKTLQASTTDLDFLMLQQIIPIIPIATAFNTKTSALPQYDI